MNLIYLLALVVSLPAQDAPARVVPKELSDLVGNFTGSWTMFGINDKGDVVPRMKWTDVITITKPTVEKDRVLVETVDEMTFTEPKIPIRKSKGKRGLLPEQGWIAGGLLYRDERRDHPHGQSGRGCLGLFHKSCPAGVNHARISPRQHWQTCVGQSRYP